MTFLLYKNTVLFSAVLAGIKNPVSREQNRHFKRSPHCEKGCSAHFGSLFDWINYFSILSSVYATDTCSSEKAHEPETAHEIACTLFLKLATKAQTSLLIEMCRHVKAFTASKLQ